MWGVENGADGVCAGYVLGRRGGRVGRDATGHECGVRRWGGMEAGKWGVMAVGREPGGPAADHRAVRVMCVSNGPDIVRPAIEI